MIATSVIDGVRDRLQKRLNTYRMGNDPLAWCQYMLGDEYMPYAKLREAFESFMKNRRSLCWGVNASGKSFSLIGILSLWWFDVHGRNSKVTVVTPSSTQSKNAIGTVGELSGAIDERYRNGLIDHRIGGQVSRDTYYQIVGSSSSGYIVARHPIPRAAVDVLKGAHSTGGSLVILEEASALQDRVIAAAHNVVTGKIDKLLAITNANNPDSYVMRLVQRYNDTGIALIGANPEDAKPWGMTKIAWQDMPAYTGEIVSELQSTHLLQKERVDEIIADSGIDSPEYNILVLAEPDFENGLSMINISHLSVGYASEWPDDGVEPRPCLGVDLALYGKKGDDTVVYAGWEKPAEFVHENDDGTTTTYIRPLTKIRRVGSLVKNDVSLLDQARWVVRLAIEHNAYDVRFDAVGVGASFEDMLDMAVNELDFPVDFTWSTMKPQGHHKEPSRYKNDRTWWFGNMRERLDCGGIDLDEEDTRLKQELLKIPYTLDSLNRMATVPKSQMAKSPDYADAAVFCAITEKDMKILSEESASRVVRLEEDKHELTPFGQLDDDPFAAYYPIGASW